MKNITEDQTTKNLQKWDLNAGTFNSKTQTLSLLFILETWLSLGLPSSLSPHPTNWEILVLLLLQFYSFVLPNCPCCMQITEEIHLLTTVKKKGISYYKICIWCTYLQRRFKGSVRLFVLQNIYPRIRFSFFPLNVLFIHTFIHLFERERRAGWKGRLGKSRLCVGQ